MYVYTHLSCMSTYALCVCMSLCDSYAWVSALVRVYVCALICLCFYVSFLCQFFFSVWGEFHYSLEYSFHLAARSGRTFSGCCSELREVKWMHRILSLFMLPTMECGLACCLLLSDPAAIAPRFIQSFWSMDSIIEKGRERKSEPKGERALFFSFSLAYLSLIFLFSPSLTLHLSFLLFCPHTDWQTDLKQ